MMCEKCWREAYLKSHYTGKSQYDCYLELLEKRKDKPCTPREQAGGWWNEEKQCDSRDLN